MTVRRLRDELRQYVPCAACGAKIEANPKWYGARAYHQWCWEKREREKAKT